ncbi:MAG TPA: VOC family protein [Thermoleophilaceae bacterium]|nr:VOC family protein [Thermoleophilaceae bacterium]
MDIARVALRVSDVERSASFYAAATGMRVRELDLDAAVLAAPGSDTTLLELRRAERPGRAPRRATGLFHTAFLYRDRASLGTAVRELAERGIPLTGASDHGVSEAVYLDDPDGLGIELYADRPRERWPGPAPGDRVGMYTEPLDLDGVVSAAVGDLGAAAAGLAVGHVHLKVADLSQAEAFWTGSPGMGTMARYGTEAVFLAADGYHHHIGANTWHSRGAEPEPSKGPGLDRVVLSGDRVAGLVTPDGVAVLVEA